ncbi:hypothetical protein Ga0100230_022100 [Opitutaceae bacterium TAV3]|nr:hypothetical protein Ga0100230_022100 [Opitutaceae bacterium TAV3]
MLRSALHFRIALLALRNMPNRNTTSATTSASVAPRFASEDAREILRKSLVVTPPPPRGGG